MAERVLPAEPAVEREIAAGGWTPSGTIESLKAEARKVGLWNLFIPDTERGAGLTVREYASLAEVMGRCWWASEVFNCSAPDTGNMEVLLAYGSKAQQDRWLGAAPRRQDPLLLRDDGARCRIVRRDQHPHPHHA